MPLKDRDARRAYRKRYFREVWYPANKAKHRALVHRYDSMRRAHNRAAVDAIKSTPCADCGGMFPAVCMDFDHRPGERKSANVSDLVRRVGPLAKILAEIQKCDLVCANCHRLRTATRRPGRL